MNKTSPRLSILRAQLAEQAESIRLRRQAYALSARNPVVRIAPTPDAEALPLPDSYWDDLEHWLKTLAPAKPAAKQPEPSADVWHSEAPSVAGVYKTRTESSHVSTARLRWWDGKAWHMNHWDATASIDKARETEVRTESVHEPLLWLRLIEADKPAQQPAQKASTHSVCIHTHGVWKVGEVEYWNRTKPAFPMCWLPCDESGWVPHVPTKEAGSPVPVGVLCCIRQEGGFVRGDTKDNPAREGKDWFGWDSIIIAWRPIAQS